ncbi:MAG: CBS domain-containing protein [Candidatus Helarchaeota archaeon]
MYNIPEGSEIKALRLKAKLTQTELAKRAKVSQSLIARIETGSVDPRLSTIKKILNAIETVMFEEKTKAINFASKNIAKIHGTKLVKEASKIMSIRGISQMPVINEKGQTIGSVREKTILNKLLEKGHEILNLKVESIMEPKIPEMPISMSIDEAKKMLLEHDAILITDEEKIAGILTKIDIIKAYSEKDYTD